MRVQYGEITEEERAAREQSGRALPNLQRAVANAPEAAAHQLGFLEATASGLSDRVRELVVMGVAAQMRNGYCWGHHVPWLERLGYTEQQIAGIHENELGVLSDEDQTIVRLARAVETMAVDDALWASAARYLSEDELVRVTLLASFYSLTGRVQAAFDVPQDEGFGGFD
jgi:4-carboxymuconolactone decarboxylase